MAGINDTEIRSMSWISNCEIPTSQMLANSESHNPMIKDNKLCIPVLQTGHFRLHVYLLMKTMQVTIWLLQMFHMTQQML